MSRRRYKVGQHLEYDKKFDRGKETSLILNPAARSSRDLAVMSEMMRMESKAGLQSILYELRGDEEGLLRTRDGYPAPALVARAEEKIKDIEQQFEKTKQRAINEGRPVPQEMPEDLQNEYLEAEAVLDVLTEEADWILKMLSRWTDKAQQENDRAVLRRGPIGSRTLRNGVCIEIDGQCCAISKKGIVKIDDKRSPYNGMTTADYIDHIVKPWCRERDKLDAAQREQAEEKPGTPYPARAHPPLPPWPDNVERPATAKTEG